MISSVQLQGTEQTEKLVGNVIKSEVGLSVVSSKRQPSTRRDQNLRPGGKLWLTQKGSTADICLLQVALMRKEGRWQRVLYPSVTRDTGS